MFYAIFTAIVVCIIIAAYAVEHAAASKRKIDDEIDQAIALVMNENPKNLN